MAKKWTVRVTPYGWNTRAPWTVTIYKANGEEYAFGGDYRRRADALKAAKAITEAELVVKEDKKR